jgi:hypothetical protein
MAEFMKGIAYFLNLNKSTKEAFAASAQQILCMLLFFQNICDIMNTKFGKEKCS